MKGYRIGIDVGGTFTDFVVVRPDDTLKLFKTPTTPRDQSQGILSGLAELAREEALSVARFLGRTTSIVHGTTTADNTLIEMNGAVTGLITTDGHRDEIELRRGFKEDIWNPALPPPPPIAQRRRRIGVPERLDFEGNIVVPLDEAAVRAALRRLRKLGTESVAVVFLFSFLDPRHELRVREIADEECPGLPISLSHEVMPSAPEFERTSTTLVNAYVGPKIQSYLGHLVEGLRDAGFRRELFVLQSNGGIMTPGHIAQRPVTVLGSGPTGGVMAACAIARKVAVKSFVCADMGGTSYDVCLVRGGQLDRPSGWNWHHRYLIGLPMIDIHSIGAGGGSIASVRGGSLQVGPGSAGSQPGPICYGRGGLETTVTDANLILGYLGGDDFCGGRMKLQTAGVSDAMLAQIARPLGLDVLQAAAGVYRLVNANMANAIRRISAQRGIDPRGLTMVVYGGNGPVHATAQARELGIGSVIVPKMSPAFSALGLLLADHVVDEVRAYISPVARADSRQIDSLYAAMEERARAILHSRGKRRAVELRRFLHLCYPGQTFDIAVPVPAASGRFTARSLAATVERFHAMHETLHTYAARDEPPILRSVRLTATSRSEKTALPVFARSSGRPRLKQKRKAYFDGRMRATPVYSGPDFRVGHRIEGPAIIEEPFTTIVLHGDQEARLDRLGNYRIDLK